MPEGEVNDGIILAEVGLVHIPVLATSDTHLLDMDWIFLQGAFRDKDIDEVIAAHPKRLRKLLK